MHGINREGSARKAGRQRELKIAPVTRAVRGALAASAAMLALAGIGPAIAGDCSSATAGTIHCNGDFADTLNFSVEDLTRVVGEQAHAAIAPLSGSVGLLAGASTSVGVGPAGIVALAGGIESIGSGDIDVENDSYIYVVSAGEAIGIYAYTDDGDVSVTNSSEIGAYSLGGLADGIFASGGDVFVGNDGAIVAMSYGWAAGIEAQGADAVEVANQGDIIVRTYGAGEAFGVYAAGPQATIDNEGTVHVRGYDQATGLYARGDGNVDVTNTGAVYAGYLDYVGTSPISSSYATSLLAVTGAEGAAIDVDNAGYLQAISFAASSGIEARSTGTGGTVSVDNSGDILSATLSYGAYATGIAASGDGDAHVDNSGSVAALSNGISEGILAASFNGEASIVNSGDVAAHSTAFNYYASSGLVAFAVNGGASVDNSGNVDVKTLFVGTGIDASGPQGVSVDNSGDVSVDAWRQFGVRAISNGDVSVDNSGTIGVSYSHEYDYVGRSYGVLASSNAGDVSVVNDGNISSDTTGLSAGIFAQAAQGNVSVSGNGGVEAASLGDTAAGIYANGLGVEVGSNGDIGAIGYGYAVGILANSVEGTHVVAGGGGIGVASIGDATGIAAYAAHGDATIESAASVHAYGMYGNATGMFALGASASVVNSGDIDVFGVSGADGVYAASGGATTVANSGGIHAGNRVGFATGIRALGDTVDIANSGDIDTTVEEGYDGRAFGVDARAYGDLILHNAGGIETEGGYAGTGAQIVSVLGNATITNAGDVAASGETMAIGANLRAYGGTYPPPAIRGSGYYDAVAAVTNTGSISAIAGGDAEALVAVGPNVIIANSGELRAEGESAIGIVARGSFGSAIYNSGDIVAHGDSFAVGLWSPYSHSAFGYIGATVDNSGSISALADQGAAVGINLSGGALDNSGEITATAGGKNGYALGVDVTDGSLVNSGEISASHYSEAIGAFVGSFYGGVTVENSGVIRAETATGNNAIAILAQNDLELNNTGKLYGNIASLQVDSTIVVHNDNGGLWSLHGLASTFGDGDDAIMNGAGGTIHLADGGIFLGTSGAAGNSFENAGTIRTSGYGVIDMGRGGSLVPSLNPLPLVNDGIIDFVDGSPDDTLVVAGDLGGDGSINLDLSVLNGGADLLYVDGSVVDGSTQTINLVIDGMPTALAGDASPVVEVTGNLPVGAFVGGHVLNADPSNFVELGVSVGTSQSGGLNIVSATPTVDGLNGTGVLAASVAQGARSLINSAIGTLRQRAGVQGALADGQSGLSPWLRVYTEKGDISPEAQGFGAGADFGFEQENRGRELGMGFTLGNLNFGVLAGSADGTQRIEGAGGDRLKLHGSGVYATWTGARFYVDASHRWMDFTARLDSASGQRETSGNATATNIEAGLTGWSAHGIAIVPQVQYTRAKIDSVGPVAGNLTQMDIDGGVSERGRVGVALSRTFAGGEGLEWTPYGSVGVVREFDGKSGFTVADAFSGTTSVDGTAAMAELGIGVRKGGLSATAGVNWTDGGALDSLRGGQLVVRYTW